MCFRAITVLPGRSLGNSQRIAVLKHFLFKSGAHSEVFTHHSSSNRTIRSSFGSIAAANLTMEEMDHSIINIVRQIHDTPAKAVFYVAGGGAQVEHSPHGSPPSTNFYCQPVTNICKNTPSLSLAKTSRDNKSMQHRPHSRVWLPGRC